MTISRLSSRSSAAAPSAHTPRVASALAATLVTALALIVSLVPRTANAQQATFKLDRLEMGGAPEDGNVVWRPVTQPKPIFFAQLGLGYSLRPLHTSNIINVARDRTTANRSPSAVMSDQFNLYATAGFQFLNRFTFAATLPAALVQDGQNPSYATGVFGGAKTTTVDPTGAAMGDIRLDFRAVLARTANERGAFGASVSMFAPSGSTANFGGDGATGAMVAVQGEYDLRLFVLSANTGIHLRPKNAINDPTLDYGLGIGNEWRWAVAAFIPFKAGKYRLGGTIFGQTGIESGSIIGDTVFRQRNTPIEWHAEGRMRFGGRDRWWAGLGAGTLIGNGYGAPDLRVVGLLGTYVPLFESDARSPDRKHALREKWKSERSGDADHDGIPDDIDACPSDPEDHKGSDPNDGCPMPPDRDNDGIPDQFDKCPDQAEDKDGIDDGDGCPEDDADKDGVPDTTDACPHEPGQPSPDPKKNGCPNFIKFEGGRVTILQQVHFKTGSFEILPDSFPMLQEIANLLKANASITKLAIEGHTDNKGGVDLNTKLSQGRADSVMKWLTSHGVETNRLEAHGYGPTRPVEDNNTESGRAANRRVEFKIVSQEDTNAVQKPGSSTP